MRQCTVFVISVFILVTFLLQGCGEGSISDIPERGFVSSVPAATWEHALVSGNGKFGALVFGNPLDEKIILNHARLYMPVHEPLPPVNTGAHLEEIRQLIADGRYRRAAEFVDEISRGEGYGEKRWTDPFIPAFNIRLKMASEGDIRDYIRYVDFSTGVAGVKWTDSNGSYSRRLFVSRSDDAVVLYVKGDKKGNISCTLNLETQSPKGTGGWNPEKMFREGIKEHKAAAGGLWMSYQSRFSREWEGSLKGYEGLSRIVVTGGETVTRGDSVIVSGADEILVLTKIEMLFDDRSDPEKLKQSLSEIEPDFKLLLERHSRLHGEIFNRSRLDLDGGADRSLTSEALIGKSRIGNLNMALLEKQYDAARYNILSSSGELFPNLQGIWSGTYGPYWSGDFTLNGNVQSAISANLSANMPECLLPFFKYMEDHIDEFRTNARLLFNCRGINVPSRASSHCLKNCFEAERPMTFWTAGAGWVSQFFYDYYLYTGDEDFLQKRALPFMKEAALFYEDFLINGPDGKLLFSPSHSPENTPANSNSQAAINSSMDIGVAKELLNNCISASRILGVGEDDIKRWETMLLKMPPYLISGKGAVKEWATPLLEDNDLHRHASHLYALFNGLPEYIANDSSLVMAFGTALDNRLEIRRREFRTKTLMGDAEPRNGTVPNYTASGDNGEIIEGRPPGEMAFGIVQQGFAAASLHKADDCAMILNWLANSYWFPNFVTTHNPKAIFNTDLSGGLPALIIRMLIDSQPGWIGLLPAWPDTIPAGKIEGVALRGGIIARELSWNKKDISLKLESHIAQKVMIRTNSAIENIKCDREVSVIREGDKCFLLLPGKKSVTVEFVLK